MSLLIPTRVLLLWVILKKHNYPHNQLLYLMWMDVGRQAAAIALPVICLSFYVRYGYVGGQGCFIAIEVMKSVFV